MIFELWYIDIDKIFAIGMEATVEYKNNLSKNDTFSIVITNEDTTDRKLTFSPSEHYFLALGDMGVGITVEKDGQTYESNGAVLVSAKSGFSVKCQTKNFISFLISRSTATHLGEYLGTDVFNRPISLATDMTLSDKKAIVERTKKFMDKKDYAGYQIRCKWVLFDIVSNYFCNTTPFIEPSEDAVPEWLSGLAEKMKQGKNYTKGVQYMTELSQKSPEHLSRSMKKHYGITPTEFINTLRMKNAAQLLIQTEQSVMDICFENGYQNISWFNTLFKENFGVSPGEYRQMFRNK